MYKHGDTISVTYPYTEHLTQTKQRAVVIISKTDEKTRKYIGAKVTSTLIDDQFRFGLFNLNFSQPIAKASEVRTNELMNVGFSLTIKKIESLNSEGLSRLIAAVKDNI